MSDSVWGTAAAISIARAEEKWWDSKLNEFVRRAQGGEKHLDCAGAMCVGGWKAARYIREKLEAVQ